MSKEQLKFKVSGRSIVYEGHRENRPKDLMDILAKLAVDTSVVVDTFRSNIEGHDQYEDEQIMELFSTAKRAREAKKAKSAVPATDSSTDMSKGAGSEAEKPQKITLSYCGKQFSYEGLLSNKKRAVIQLLVKQRDVTPEIAIQTFRDNLNDATATDDEIWQMVSDAKAAKQKTRDTSKEAITTPSPSTGGYAAIDELAGMPREERDAINNFIKQVLEQPTMDIAARLQEEPGAHGYQAAPADENPELGVTARTSGKVAVYCQEENSTASKLVYVTANTTFEDFSAVVEKKFGRKMALSFYEGDDVVELDDDDVLAMFLEMSSQGDGKKLKLICSNPDTRRKTADDKLTEGANGATSGPLSAMRNKAFSSGELEVKEERTYRGHSLAVYCCAFSPKGEQFVTASRDRSVRLWNTRAGSCTVMKGGHNGFVLSCDFSPKGNRVVSSSDDRTIKLWNTTTCAKVATLKGHEDKVYCVQYNSTGEYIVSGSCDHTVRVWNAESGSKQVTLRGHTLAVFSCCFSKSDGGRYVISGSDDRLVKLWDWHEGKEVRSFIGHTGTVWACQYSNDDAYVVSASMDHEVKLWASKTGTCLRTLLGHRTPVHHATFSTDGKYIFSCARDWTIMIWRTDTGEHVETITGHVSTVYHMAVQGTKLLTSSLDDTLKLWAVTEKEK